MGDKEQSLEAEQEGEKDTKMIPHCPPVCSLPEEIRKMARSEIACSYCGISYLIFHEFNRLHTRLAQLEAELQELSETAQREKAQREALERETAFHLEVQKRAEEQERRTREELEERSRDEERALREEFEQKSEREGREMKDECEKIGAERERQLRRELGDSEAERLRRQREELESGAEEREKVLRDALQKANKDLDELRKYVQQLEERLAAAAASAKEEAERILGKEEQQGEILRGACVRQQRALRATLSALRSTGGELADVRGFLGQLTGAWQGFRSQILQHSTQVFSVMREELRHSNVGLQKMREEKEHLTQQLMEQRRQGEAQLCQQREDRETLLRLKEELEEKRKGWLSCQQRCDTAQEQLLSWRQRGEQMSRKCCAAEGEVTRLREALESVQQETRELRREREVLIESHGRALTKMEEDCRQQMASKLAAALEAQGAQNALHLREQLEELRGKAELELTADREKNQLLLLQCQRDSSRLQQKLQERERELRGLQDELQDERRMRGEEMHRELRRSRQQEALQLSQAEAELRLMAERNAELQEETDLDEEKVTVSVGKRRLAFDPTALTALRCHTTHGVAREAVALLQETVRVECVEREELTAALSQAQEELHGLRPPAAPHPGSSRSPPNPTETHAPSRIKHFQLHSQLQAARSSNSPSTLRPSPACADGERGRSTDRGAAGRSSESWNRGGMLGGEKRREGRLPRLKGSRSMSEVKCKVSLVMERKEKL